MKPYNDLSRIARLRLLHGLAVTALAHYDLKNPEIAFFGYETNLLFRVTAASGERFMLRLATPGWRAFEDLRSEAMWLSALIRDTLLSVPKIIPARSGEYVLPLSSPVVPGVWNASLMSWVPGRLLGRYLTELNLEKMGALFAGLHHHGASWVPPTGFTTRRFEHWLSRGEENRITSSGLSLSGEPQAGSIIAQPANSRELLDRMHLHVEQAYAAIDRSDLRVIHCDLWHNNIKLHQGVLHPLDFEDTVWGFRAHDIAMAMLDLMEDSDEARYTHLLAAFRRGYEANMPWPDDPIEPFQIGRLLWKINWVARFQPQGLSHTVAQHVPVFEHYLQTGRVILPPKT
jgi:Ser/Thr protein kinase RdoA (MazF antagonist)